MVISLSATSHWTPEIEESFHTNVRLLSEKLEKSGRTPGPPQNYREERGPNTSEEYMLPYEEEQHLADHIAFLSQTSQGHERVSAVALESYKNPPALTVRLASNKFPKVDAITGLRKIFSIVRGSAMGGKSREEDKSTVFHAVVGLHQHRIYSRILPSLWGNGKHAKKPLHVQIRRKLDLAKLLNYPDVSPTSQLMANIAALANVLERVDCNPDKDQVPLLKEAIYKSYEISNSGSSKSLESHLESLKLDPSICQSRAVLEIDKLSKYLELSNDLIRFSRQPRTRPLFQNLTLEMCQSYPSSKPRGGCENCLVRGEVQLILHYEKYAPSTLPPRVIGSSKSACFLCDLFIKKHGKYQISHSHMKLYPKWTIPDCDWMTKSQKSSFANIIQAMDSDVSALLKSNKPFYSNHGIVESRAHLLLRERRESILSSIPDVERVASPLETDPCIEVRTTSTSKLATSAQLISNTIYYFQDLPIEIIITASTSDCVLLVGKVDYIFDLRDISSGHLIISEASKAEVIPEALSVRDLPDQIPRSFGCKSDSGFSICVHDGWEYPLLTVRWGNLRGVRED